MMIGGVAAGIAESLNIDPVITRLFFVLLVVLGGSGVILYVILWIVLPVDITAPLSGQNLNNMEDNKDHQDRQEQQVPVNKNKHVKKDDGSLIAGLILISLGVIFLVIRYVPRIDFGDLWPVILIVIGIVLLRNAFTGGKKQA